MSRRYKVTITADPVTYAEAMKHLHRKMREMKRLDDERRRERAWQNTGIIAIIASVIIISWSTVHLIATAAW